MNDAIIDPTDTITHTCLECGATWPTPRGQTMTRGSRPCGWDH